MNASDQRRWFWAVLAVGVMYFAAGIVFAELAKTAASNQVRVAWRLAAWGISATAFATHIAYEHIRLRSSPVMTALHASFAVGLGAFGLAISASIHAQTTHQRFPAFAIAVWPVMTALPAFVVALALAAVLARTWARR